MTWIRTIGLHDPDLTPELAETYQELAPLLPKEYLELAGDDVSDVIKTHSLDPKAMRLLFTFGLHLVNGPSPLSRREREMINTVVSATNRCFY